MRYAYGITSALLLGGAVILPATATLSPAEQRIVSAVDAIECAVAMQRRVRASATEAAALTIRVGIATGEAVFEDGDGGDGEGGGKGRADEGMGVGVAKEFHAEIKFNGFVAGAPGVVVAVVVLGGFEFKAVTGFAGLEDGINDDVHRAGDAVHLCFAAFNGCHRSIKGSGLRSRFPGGRGIF